MLSRLRELDYGFKGALTKCLHSAQPVGELVLHYRVQWVQHNSSTLVPSKQLPNSQGNYTSNLTGVRRNELSHQFSGSLLAKCHLMAQEAIFRRVKQPSSTHPSPAPSQNTQLLAGTPYMRLKSLGGPHEGTSLHLPAWTYRPL